MSRSVKTIGLDSTVTECLELMVDGFNTLPVVDAQQRCVGVISRTDLTEALFLEDQQLTRFIESEGAVSLTFGSAIETCNERLVREMRSDQLVLVTLASTIKEACKLMSSNQVHHLPVVDDGQKVVGMVSSLDIVDWFAR
ncbi:MAG: CBS domain-containing protein [Planctomycetota bacterium]